MTASSCRASAHGCDGKYRKLEEILQEYKGVPGALIPVLHQAQLLFGYLPHDVRCESPKVGPAFSGFTGSQFLLFSAETTGAIR